MENDTKYGFGKNPPYSLYQGEDGKWGLIDKDGRKLDAVFEGNMEENVFSCVPWEAVTFNENEGFELLAWYDPCEVWFNFTFDNPDYPDRWGKLLWKKSEKSLRDFLPLYLGLLPEKDRWFPELLDYYFAKEKEIAGLYNDDYDKEEAETEILVRSIKDRYPMVNDAGSTSALLAPILDNDTVGEEARTVIWCKKVYFDSMLRTDSE